MANYCTLAELKAFVGTAVSDQDTLLNLAISSASRAIENHTGRRFWLDPTAVVRTFEPTNTHTIRVDDIGSTSGVIVETDAAGDGTFETTWASTDFQLLPVNAAYESPEARPWTSVRAVGNYAFPMGSDRRLDRVRITAKWGWPAVPDAVSYACRIKAARLFQRKNSLQGVAAFDDFGPVRISRAEDGDVVSLLTEYSIRTALVG